MKKKYYSDLQRLRNLNDEEIDYSDIPELDEAFFEKAVIVLPQTQGQRFHPPGPGGAGLVQGPGQRLSDPNQRPAAGLHGGAQQGLT